MRIYIANLGKYNEGELVGAWFTPPVDYDEMAERIGLNDRYEEYAIHDYELPFEIDEYTPIEEVNRLCEMVEDLPEYIQEELSELQSYFGSIEELCEHEDDIICHSGCDDMADVARCYLEESGQLGELPAHLQNYIDYAAYGRDMELDGTFIVTNHGVYEIIRWTRLYLFLKVQAAFLFQGRLLLPHLLERTDNMKKIRSYTSIWSVEKVLYSINDFKLPFPITFTQMAWFVVSVFAVMLLGNLPPLSFIDGAFLKYFGVPFALTWFMCQKTFDGKKPYGFLKSVLAYLVRPKLTYAGKPVKLEKEYPAQPITAVRSDIYGISD